MRVHVRLAVSVLIVSVGLSACKEKVTYPEFTQAEATSSLQGYLVSMPINQQCQAVSLVSENDSVVVPASTLTPEARNRQAALRSAGLLRVEQVVSDNVPFVRSTLSFAAYALYTQGTTLDFSQLCSVKLQMLGDAHVVPVTGHPEFQGVQYQVVPATWPASMWSPGAVSAVSVTGYPRKVTAFYQYMGPNYGWMLKQSGLDGTPAGTSSAATP